MNFSWLRDLFSAPVPDVTVASPEEKQEADDLVRRLETAAWLQARAAVLTHGEAHEQLVRARSEYPVNRPQ